MGITGGSGSGRAAPQGLPPPLARLWDLLVPAPCLSCGHLLDGAVHGASPHLGLCLACRGRLARPARGCSACGEPIPAAALTGLPPGWLCNACRRDPPPFRSLLAAWSYEGPVTDVVRALKFGRLDYLGAHLARELRELVPSGDRWDGVVPVPLHWRRRWSRGFDQAERIARPLARLLGTPFLPVLRRGRPTRRQARLSRDERLVNPRHAFALRRRSHAGRHGIAGLRLVVVDDVVTTGATLRAAAETLRSGGAREVLAVAAARTPEAAG
ncbi:MAG: phosphoribosyltransferase family protein [Thermoanaerobaculia bacterium]